MDILKKSTKYLAYQVNIPNTVNNTTDSFLLLKLIHCSSLGSTGTAAKMKPMIYDVLDEFKFQRENLTRIFTDGTNATNLALFKTTSDDISENLVTDSETESIDDSSNT